MPLQKQAVPINFVQGLDLKSDPYQVAPGKFLALSNSIFTAAGRLSKRYGYADITTLPNTSQTTLTTLNDNLIATGANLYAYIQDTDQWLNQGIIQPVQLAAQPLIRSSTSQSAPDIAISSNGLVCLVYVDNAVSYYQISDSTTGQQVVARTAILSTASVPRVYTLGVYFIITYIATIAGTPTLQMLAIPLATPASPKAPITISSNVASLTAGYDAYVAADQLFIAWGLGSAAVGFAYVTSALAVSATVTFGSTSAALVSVTVDTTQQAVWITYWDSGTTTAKTTAYSYIQGLLVSPTTVITTTAISEITSTATGGVCTIFYQATNNYTYTDSTNSSIRSDFVSSVPVTRPVSVTTGTVGATTIIRRSVGLASKAFTGPDGNTYMLAVYGNTTQTNSLDNSQQPSYFLMDSSGNILMRLAYSNGGGYLTTEVLPNICLYNGAYCVPYRVTDFLTTTNKGTNLPSGTPVNAIYTQTGINLAKIGLNISSQYSSEIAGSLHLTGGQLWQYDGLKPVEHGFHVWPENVVVKGDKTVGGLVVGKTYNYVFTYEWTDGAGNLHRSAPSIPTSITVSTAPASFTGNRDNGSAVITSVSSFTGLQVGQAISGTGIPAGTAILSLNTGASTLTMTAAATSGTSTATTITPTTISSAVINVPTLRLTAKVSPNPVRIVGYRWSTDQPVYYQFTSVTSPTANSTSTDSVSFTDSATDASILGNAILYTTGGVVENIAAPASIASALWANRLFLIDAEDRNVLWYSKVVIENTPVEMSDLLTLYIAPTTGAQGSTGPMTALSAMDDKLIIFKRGAIYYINGSGPDNTGANSTFSDPVFITATVGCINPNSIVLMPNGIMFQSDKGIWLLGRGLETQYIGAAVETYNDYTVLAASTIPGTNQVRFVLEGNVTLMYDYFYNQWSTHTNIQAISATLYQSSHTYLNSAGHVFQETANTYLDGSVPVLMSLTTSWINIAGLQGFERFYYGNLLGTYYTPFKLNVTLAYNYNPAQTQSIIITPDNYAPAYGEEALYGSGGAYGGSEGNVFTARFFPEKQKCQSFQVSIQEIYDSSLGASAGQGLSLSGLLLTTGVKRGSRTQSAAKSFG
jgi:hypothetical protein